MTPALHLRRFDRIDYAPCWQAMKHATDLRSADDANELWLLEHPPVFTLGQAGKPEHVLNAGDIPLVQTDRGGQVTYHGPGQTVMYLLLELAPLGLGARALVTGIEQALVALLAEYGLEAASRPGAPGVYVGDAKIASLGLRIRRGRSYHGLSLNRDMDLDVFQRINPCGHIGQPMTSLALLGVPCAREAVEARLLHHVTQQLGLPAPTQTFTTLPDVPVTEAATLNRAVPPLAED